MNRKFYFILFVFVICTSIPFAFAQTNVRVSGKVLDANGKPATDAEVRLVEIRRTVKTNQAGEFVFENVPPGQYLLEVGSPRMGQALQSIMVTAEPAALEVILDKTIHKEEVVVTANPDVKTIEEINQAVDVLTGDDLTRKEQPTIGETLSQEVGVNSTYFGPGASRPVIRGIGGDRIRVLVDGIGVGDASTTSPDHAVSIDPGSLDRVEVVRGPATLLYGSSAVGGVVNLFDNRIPSSRTDTPATGSFELRTGSVADEWSASGSATGTAGPLGWHVDGMKRDAEDYNIPGFALANPQQGEEGSFETLVNSNLEADSAGIGFSYIADPGFIGFSYSSFNTNYGNPAEEEVRIDLEQRRFDVRGEVNHPFGFLRGLKAKVGTTNYEHVELEGEEVGTQFLNDSWETRIEGIQKPYGSITGSFGVQVANREFSALGEEAFVPPTDTNNYGIFVFEEIGPGPLKFQVGARYENQEVTAQTEGINNRKLDGISASGGVLWLPNDDYSLGFSIARSVKLPNAEELFSNGPHIATNAFEIGDPNLKEETSIGIDVSLRKRTGKITGELNFFANRFNDFIFEQFTDEIIDDLQVFRYVQQDANFWGAEFHVDAELYHIEPHHILLEVSSDFVRAENRTTNEPLPRIPPYRIGGGLRYQGSHLSGGVEVRYVAEQDRVATFEDPTDSYTMLNATVGYRFFAGPTVHDIIFRATNLTNEEARNHVSFLKDLAPLPGRDFSIIYKFLF
jgi:iron complex outermembrane recepter protein